MGMYAYLDVYICIVKFYILIRMYVCKQKLFRKYGTVHCVRISCGRIKEWRVLYYYLIEFCVGEIKGKSVLYFP